MEKIVAVTFDLADQKCVTYNALEWHNFIADTREYIQDVCLVEDHADDYTLEELFDRYYGDEFWFEVLDGKKLPYSVAFDLRSETFVVCADDNECEMYWEMAQASGCEEEVFWAE